jgi:hemolysin activation/secretion protein
LKPPAAALAALLLVLAAADAFAAAGESTRGRHSESQGPVYLVGAIEISYAQNHPRHPPLWPLRRVDLALGEASDGFVGPRRGGTTAWFNLDELPLGPPIRIYASGLRELNEQIVAQLVELGLIGVYVAPNPEDIDPATGADQRATGQTTMRLQVHTGRTQGLRTFASGWRIDDSERADNPAHSVLKRNSPLQPVGVGGRGQGDLLLRQELDNYVHKLNRHPGRHIEVSITPTAEPGGVYVDYLVAEDKPWSLYAQYGNTGTDQTNQDRQRFGFQHTQLTGNDDVLRVDYVTANFDDVNAVLASYERPIPSYEHLRLRGEGMWQTYDASEFGQSGFFEGTQWNLGADVLSNVYQDRSLFLDASAGARWMDVESDSLGITDSDQYFVPRIGLVLQRFRQTSNLFGRLGFEANVSSIAGSDASKLMLGRVDLDDDWLRLNWDLSYATYLDPILNGRAWKNPRTPLSSTLAHEVALRTSGQYAFDTRLIPTVQYVMGGFYTVRGYPQATIASDTAALVSAEYRYHVPRAFLPERTPRVLPLVGDFRVAPQRVYGRPDWDLVLRSFVDWGRAIYSGNIAGEEDETLWSVGVGVELMIKRWLSLRLDHGIAQSDVRDVESGDSETHFIATIRY